MRGGVGGVVAISSGDKYTVQVSSLVDLPWKQVKHKDSVSKGQKPFFTGELKVDAFIRRPATGLMLFDSLHWIVKSRGSFKLLLLGFIL